MRLIALVLILLLGGSEFAAASCADDYKELKARVERAQKRDPTPQTTAAAKELKKADESLQLMDEVYCYNALARARRALRTPLPPPQKKAQE